MNSSFQKCTRPAHRGIPGAKVSPFTAETVLSCGVSALDYILGGGVPLGCILLAEEDAFGTYCRQLLKYYVAEGIEQKHRIYFASGDVEPSKFLRELPKTLRSSADDNPRQPASAPSTSDGDLKIAFRYLRMPKQDSLLDYEELDHVFDFSDRIESANLSSACVNTFSPCETWGKTANRSFGIVEPNYASVLGSVSALVDKAKTDDSAPHSAVRIALQGLGGPAWGSVSSFSSFLHALKALIRGEPVNVFVTVPAVITEAHPNVLRRCRRVADVVLKVQAFDDHERGANPLYKNYHGLLQIVKRCRLSSLNVVIPDCDFLFHQRSKKLLIERLHLPPELGTDEIVSADKMSGMVCASNQKFNF